MPGSVWFGMQAGAGFGGFLAGFTPTCAGRKTLGESIAVGGYLGVVPLLFSNQASEREAGCPPRFSAVSTLVKKQSACPTPLTRRNKAKQAGHVSLLACFAGSTRQHTGLVVTRRESGRQKHEGAVIRIHDTRDWGTGALAS